MPYRIDSTIPHVSGSLLKRLRTTMLQPSILLLVLAGLLLVGCRAAPLAASSAPAIVEATDQEGINRVILTERAAQRLDVQTAQVREEQINGETRLVVPYSAIIYDLQGDTWLYTNPETLTYIREPITVDYVEGDLVYLTDGPPAGTEIATVAVAELYGTDTGVGK